MAAQLLQASVLPMSRRGCAVTVQTKPRAVELADPPGRAVLLFIGIALVAAAQAEGAKRRCRLPHAELIVDYAAEKSVQSVVTGDVADVFPDNDASSTPTATDLFVGPPPTVHTIDPVGFIDMT